MKNLLLMLILAMMSSFVTWAKTPKVVKSSDGKTLTFYYDDATHTEGSQVYTDLSNYSYYPGWYNNSNITTVVFDESFKDACPTTTKAWFLNLTSLKNVTGIEYLNTSEVKTMYRMFEGCSSLTTLDLSSFNTAAVEDMSGMFSGCSSLTSLDLSSFNTEAVENISSMFKGCSSLTSLDLSSFNTANVKNMSGMFYGCRSLTTLDLSSFNTAKVKNMSGMFQNCKNLKTIFASSNFIVSDGTYAFSIFVGCFSLVGGNGTRYKDFSVTDATYARLDGGPESSTPGYFTDKSTYSAKAVLSDNTLTFYFDKESHDDSYPLNSSESDPGWMNNTSITTIVFDPMFQYMHPTTTHKWFAGLTSLTTLTGKEYLMTSQTTDMSQMFSGCTSLTTLDLTTLNTSQVTDMSQMFSGCTALTTIFASTSFKTSQVTASDDMFSGCTSLIGGNGTTITDNPVDATYACLDTDDTPGYFTDQKDCVARAVISTDEKTLTFFYGTTAQMPEGTVCNISGFNHYTNPGWYNKAIETVVFDPTFQFARPTTTYLWFNGLTSLASITGWEYLNTSEVTDMRQMFFKCSSLTSLDLSHFDTRNVTLMTSMFYGCSSLTSLDLSSLNTKNVTNIEAMFGSCTSLASINLSSFNTKQVTHMTQMFTNCSSLTTLDLSSFYTPALQNTYIMFQNCSNLRTILASQNFSTSAVTSSDEMFSGCTSLVGGSGTAYDASCIDATYARIDGTVDDQSNTLSGYFTDQSSIITLANDEDNTSVITRNSNATKNVLLSGRTLYRDNDWNTLYLPFDVDLNDTKSPLYGAVAMELNSDSFNAGTLTLDFAAPADNKLTAGTPYIIKWVDTNNTLPDLVNPVFQGVTFSATPPSTISSTDTGKTNWIDFTGTYKPVTLTAGDTECLYLSGASTLYYPSEAITIGACRAYFLLKNGLTAGDPSSSLDPIKAFILHFDEDSESTSITTLDAINPSPSTWFTLDGRLLLSPPTTSGLYIHNGQKVHIK